MHRPRRSQRRGPAVRQPTTQRRLVTFIAARYARSMWIWEDHTEVLRDVGELLLTLIL